MYHHGPQKSMKSQQTQIFNDMIYSDIFNFLHCNISIDSPTQYD